MKVFSLAILFSVAMPLFAESAPVYDADSMSQQQFESADQQQDQDLPPPPAPNQEKPVISSMPPHVSAPSSRLPEMGMSTDQRLARAEQQISNLQNSMASQRLDSLQGDVQSLRGQLEQLNRQLKQLQSQQKSMYVDLDKRLSQPKTSTNKSATLAAGDGDSSDAANVASDDESATSKAGHQLSKQAMGTDTTTHTDNQPNVAEEQQVYQTAYDLIKAKKYNDAVSALQSMLKKYPSGQFASNAHYWLGELYGLMGKNDQALTEFTTVVKTYPDSPRVSDAQLKVGLVCASQSKWADAKLAFKRVINHYPGTASARLAAEQLKQIKQAGH